MTSKLTVRNIEGLTSGAGSDTVILRTGNADTVTVTNTAITMLGNLNIGTNSITATGNSVLTTTSANFKMADLTTNAFYRTGTWTPILSDSTASVAGATIHTLTPQIQQGYYLRIGDFVSVHWYYQTPGSSYAYTNGTSGAGQIQFHGLPFKVSARTNFFPVATCGTFDNWTGWGASYTPMGYGQTNDNYVALTYAYTDGVTPLQSQYHSAVDSFSVWSMHYITDDV